MIDLQHVKTFMTVAETRNFGRAALIVGCAQSTVSYHIKQLERELGASLVTRFRFSKDIALTDVGLAIISYARRLVALAEETKAVAQKSSPARQ